MLCQVHRFRCILRKLAGARRDLLLRQPWLRPPVHPQSITKAQNEKKGQSPRIITCPNEMVALSMADAYAHLTGKPQCVLVHVDVGTQGLGAAVHNASCGRAPVLIFAGLSPYTCDGELRGSRTEYIHWIQDVPDQKQIVGQFCRYMGEIKKGVNVKQMVGRALQFAMSAPGISRGFKGRLWRKRFRNTSCSLSVGAPRRCRTALSR